MMSSKTTARRLRWLLLLAGLVGLGLGCRPSFYRQQADEDAYRLIDSKSARLGVVPAEYRIEVDPRSRMYNPHNPDCEPMPPDDPSSHQLMQCVDCKKGSKCWRCLPKTPFVENPGWLNSLPVNEDGEVVVDLEEAVRLALIHSPEYQSQLEELYLSALDVSFERFRFDTQFFGGSSIFYTSEGEVASGTGQPASVFEVNPLRPGNRLQARRLNATGGELVVGLANSLVWQFAGPDDYSGTTLLDFTFIQPLLRMSGRARVLERLTISERTLLANVRQMERYRRKFYVNIVTGDNPGQGPSRRGGFFGGSGLEGFSGVGGGGFGRVGGGGQFQGGFGDGNTGGAGAQGAGGYIGLLQQYQVLINQRANVVALNDSVQQLQASYEAGRIDRFQVDLARQALYNAQSQLLSAENGYITFLENFKINLGLPPELDFEIQDNLLAQFNLLDPDLTLLQEEVTEALNQLRLLRQRRMEGEAEVPGEEEIPGQLVPPELPDVESIQPGVPLGDEAELATTIDRLLEAVDERIAVAEADLEELQQALPRRIEALEKLSRREEAREANIEETLFSIERLRQRASRIEEELVAINDRIANSTAELQALSEEPDVVDTSLNELIELMTALSSELLELSLNQASARLEAIHFEPVELSAEEALAIASQYRRDWMNARANLVDSWRLIYFNANDLQSDLDIVFSGDLGNVGDNPFRLRSTNGRLRVGLEFDAPLTRLSERNIYRQSLIEYQQARRQYYQFRDRLYQGLRNTLRQVKLNEINFELRRAAVQVAISQVDLTQLRLSEPPVPGETAQFGNTTARDLVQSLSDLLNVQNDFLSVWVNNEVQRLILEADLGVMELAPNGLRIENEMPLEMYLANLPLKSEDLGLSLEAFKVSPEELAEGIPGINAPCPPSEASPMVEPLNIPPLQQAAPGEEGDEEADLEPEVPELEGSSGVEWPGEKLQPAAPLSRQQTRTELVLLPELAEESKPRTARSPDR